MLETQSLAGTVTNNLTSEVCPRCGRYRMAVVDEASGDHGEVLLCVGCGYYRIRQDIIIDEGVAFLVECPGCQRCQSWIRYPIHVYRENKDIRRLLYWTCACCHTRHRVWDTTVDPTKASNNWYAHLMKEAKILKV